jgi:hypothetical protein
MILAAPTYRIFELDDGWFIVLRRVSGGIPAGDDPATSIAKRSAGGKEPARFPPGRRVEAEAFIRAQQLADKGAASRLQILLSESANPSADERAAVVAWLRTHDVVASDGGAWIADAIERGEHHPKR